MNSEILKKSYQYISENGYSVFPINESSKTPAIKSWLEYQKVPADVYQAAEWWGKSNYNIAIVTGSISNITVVDLDMGKADGKTTPLESFPKTYTVQTPSGGYHLYYRYTPNIKLSSNQYSQYPHLDIRNDGGYVVAPPSTTDKGEYKVIHDIPIVDFPEELFKGTKDKLRQGIQTLKQFKTMEEGAGRNDALTSFANHMFKIMPTSQWGTAAHAIMGANGVFKKPLPDKEVEVIINSMMKRVTPSKRIEWHVNAKGIPYTTGENILKTFKNDDIFINKFRYNTFTGIPETCFETKKGLWEPMMKEHIYKVYVKIQEKYPVFNAVALMHIESSLVTIAHEVEVSPIAEYIKAIKWDGTKRLEDWISMVYGVEQNDYHAEIGKNWMLALVKRIMYPGTQVDSSLIIDGDQGAGKSRSFRTLCSFKELGDLFHETSETPDNKDFLISLMGNIVVEFSEGVSMRHTDALKMKSFMTKQSDKYRPPYEKTNVQFPRQCVFAMTTNESQYLKDLTGNRRWYPVSMPRNIKLDADIKWLIKYRDQLFAEAYNRIDEPHWELSEESQSYLDDLHEEKSTTDPMVEYIFEWYIKLSEEKKEEGVIPTVVFQEALPKLNGAAKFPSPLDSKKVGEILVDILKLEYQKRSVNGARVMRYFPTDHTPNESLGIPDPSGFSDDISTDEVINKLEEK